MLKTQIKTKNGRPYICINGKLFSPLAYTTYFEERGQFSDFIKNGYRMFFVNVSFTTLPINNVSGFSPFLTGVFDGSEADYSEFDSVVRGILNECPDAFIFPRINIAMPQKWLDENPYETVETLHGKRESLYSDAFRSDGAKLLCELVSHIRSAVPSPVAPSKDIARPSPPRKKSGTCSSPSTTMAATSPPATHCVSCPMCSFAHSNYA